MTLALAFVSLFYTAGVLLDDSTAPPEPENQVSSVPGLSVVASAFGTLGNYSTDTKSRSLSGYVTVSKLQQDYYTVGYSTLWLERDDAGGKYYTQQLGAARASVFLPPRVSLALHYAYLNEGEIQSFSQRSTFHWMGGGVSYWFSPFQVAGSSFTLALSSGDVTAGIVRGYFSFEIASGIWSTTTAIMSDVSWTPSLFSVHQTVSVPFFEKHYLVVSAGAGRRAFYFDNEALVMYNQRVVQTRFVQLKAVVNIVGGIYIIPSFDYNGHDEYSASYGSVGVRAVF